MHLSGVRQQHMSIFIISLSKFTNTNTHTHIHTNTVHARLFSVLIRIENCPAKINRWHRDEGVGGATVVHFGLLLID